MQLIMNNLFSPQRRVNDIRPIGKPTNIHDSLRNKKPYVQEHVLLNYDDWKTIESVELRSILERFVRHSNQSVALTEGRVVLNEHDRYNKTTDRTYPVYKVNWFTERVR